MAKPNDREPTPKAMDGETTPPADQTYAQAEAEPDEDPIIRNLLFEISVHSIVLSQAGVATVPPAVQLRKLIIDGSMSPPSATVTVTLVVLTDTGVATSMALDTLTPPSTTTWKRRSALVIPNTAVTGRVTATVTDAASGLTATCHRSFRVIP